MWFAGGRYKWYRGFGQHLVARNSGDGLAHEVFEILARDHPLTLLGYQGSHARDGQGEEAALTGEIQKLFGVSAPGQGPEARPPSAGQDEAVGLIDAAAHELRSSRTSCRARSIASSILCR